MSKPVDLLELEGFAARTANGTQQSNKLVPPAKYFVKGRLYYKRAWNYNTAANTERFKEYLPAVIVELFVEQWGTGKYEVFGKPSSLTEAGEFYFKDVPRCKKIGVKISLENNDGITKLYGNENLVSKPDYEVKKGNLIWRRQDLDIKKLQDTKTDQVDFGDVEIQATADTDANFAELCDMYKTMWRGHNFIRDKTGHVLSACPVYYPVRTISHHKAGSLFILPGDVKDADVLLHEYGHYIGHEMLGGLTHPGYGFDDDVAGQHGPRSEEHYESAWNEGHATFLSCAISDDATYHDGYDANLTMRLDTDNITIGPHCEGSIQCALWDILKVQGIDFRTGFWRAFTSKHGKADTIFAFYENWVAEGCPDVAKVKASLKKFNLHIGYRYTRSLRAGASLDPKNPVEFKTVRELYTAYGTAAGGTEPEYSREFYNRNRYVRGGKFKEGSAATLNSFTLVPGTTYIVPERFEIT